MFLFYLFLLFGILLFETMREKEKFIDFLSLFNFFFIFSYILTPLVFNASPLDLDEWRFLKKNSEAGQSLSVFSIISFSYCFLVFGYLMGVSRRGKQVFVMKISNVESRQYAYLVSLTFLIVSIFMVYLWKAGGVSSVISNAKHVRAGRLHYGLIQYFSYVTNFLDIALLCFASFAVYGKKIKMKIFSKYIFFVLLILTMIKALSTGGRGNMGMIPILLLFFFFNTKSSRITVGKIVTFCTLGMCLLVFVKYGKSAIWSMWALENGFSAFVTAFVDHQSWYVSQTQGIHGTLVSILRNFDHHLTSIYTSMLYPEYYESPRLFFDWIRASLDLLPGVGKEDFFVTGTPSYLNKLVFEKDGYVPPGYIAMGIINGGVVWLFLNSFISGYIGGKVNQFLIKNWMSSPIIPGVFLAIAFFWKDAFIGPDPFMAFFPNIMLFLFLFLFTLFFKPIIVKDDQ